LQGQLAEAAAKRSETMTEKSGKKDTLTVAQKMLPTLSGSGAFSDLDD
jgi:hypothetical protein